MITDYLRELVCEAGPSGFVERPAAVAAKMLAPLVDELEIDRLGSVRALRRSKKEGAPTLMLDAHIDEIGLMVTGYDGGFLSFTEIGGVDARMLPAREVIIMGEDGDYPGVITSFTAATLTEDSPEKAFEMEDLYIDTGMDESTVREKIKIGAPVVYREKYVELANGFASAKSMDDRSCVTAILYAMELLKQKDLDCNIAVVFSNFEETGGAGAKTAAWGIHPDAAIAVDVTFGTTPDAKEDCFDCGSGAAICFGANANRQISLKLREIAKRDNIPFEIEPIPGNTGTNAWSIEMVDEGIPCGIVSIPLRYMHTPVETLMISDIEYVGKLLAAYAEEFGKGERE